VGLSFCVFLTSILSLLNTKKVGYINKDYFFYHSSLAHVVHARRNGNSLLTPRGIIILLSCLFIFPRINTKTTSEL
jgi:hypothetical protein